MISVARANLDLRCRGKSAERERKNKLCYSTQHGNIFSLHSTEKTFLIKKGKEWEAFRALELIINYVITRDEQSFKLSSLPESLSGENYLINNLLTICK